MQTEEYVKELFELQSSQLRHLIDQVLAGVFLPAWDIEQRVAFLRERLTSMSMSQGRLLERAAETYPQTPPTPEVGPDPTIPGPPLSLTGKGDCWFYGEVSVAELIDGATLAERIGLTAGVAQHSDEPWLKFSHQGKVLYVAKKPYRYSVSWDAIHAQGAVFGTDQAVIELGGLTYRCRLLTGGDADPASIAGGEWDDLLYPIHVNDPEERQWAQYTNADLVVRPRHGSRTWCQETSVTNSAQRVSRGLVDVRDFSSNTSSISSTNCGWRPVLELVNETTAT